MLSPRNDMYMHTDTHTKGSREMPATRAFSSQYYIELRKFFYEIKNDSNVFCFCDKMCGVPDVEISLQFIVKLKIKL